VAEDTASVTPFTGKQVKIIIAGLVSALVSVGYFGDRIWRDDPFTGTQGDKLAITINHIDDHLDKVHTIQQTMLKRMADREQADARMLEMLFDHVRQEH